MSGDCEAFLPEAAISKRSSEVILSVQCSASLQTQWDKCIPLMAHPLQSRDFDDDLSRVGNVTRHLPDREIPFGSSYYIIR